MGGTAVAGTQDNRLAFEVAAAKEGLLVFAVNMTAMLAIFVIHHLMAEIRKIDMNLGVMKKQAEQQGQFAKQMLAEPAASPKKADSSPKVSKAPEGVENEDNANEVRKRTGNKEATAEEQKAD